MMLMSRRGHEGAKEDGGEGEEMVWGEGLFVAGASLHFRFGKEPLAQANGLDQKHIEVLKPLPQSLTDDFGSGDEDDDG